MTLGWIKYGQLLHLIPEVGWAGAGGTKMRVKLWEGLVKSGVEIRVLTEISHRHIPKLTEMQGRLGGLLHYSPGGSVKGLDALVVECGPQSLLYGSGEGLPYVVRANMQIAAYKGLVLYFQHDLDLGFCFTTESFGPSYFLQGWDRLAPSLSLTEDKTWVILTQPFRTNAFRDLYGGRRSPYRELNIPVETFTIAMLGIEDPLPVRKNPKWDLVYALNHRPGMSYPNVRDLADYYGVHKGKRVAIYGEWPDKIQEMMPRVHFPGAAPPGQQREKMNKGACGIHIGGKRIWATATLSSRFYEHLSSGTIMLLDDGYSWLKGRTGKYLPRLAESLFVSKDDVRGAVTGITVLPYKARKHIWEEEWEGVQHLRNPRLLCERLFEIIKKYRGQYLAQHYRHIAWRQAYLDFLEEYGNFQERIKVKCFRRGWKNVLHYPRVCNYCGKEVAFEKGHFSTPILRCVECGGKMPRLQRHPRLRSR